MGDEAKTPAEEVLERIARREPGLQPYLQELPSALVIEALRVASEEHARIVLCDALGFRHEGGAVAELVSCLDDESARVRSAAADALAKVRDPAAGPSLLVRFELPDPDLGVRRMLLAALGAVGHRPAIPLLIRWLGNPDPSQRGAAAWSLGAMRAREALAALEAALASERLPYPKERMTEAVRAIRRASAADVAATSRLAANVLFEAGSENAPDSRHGLDRLQVQPNGRFRYHNRQSGRLLAERTGSVAASAVSAIAADLAAAGFPRVPEHPQVPGASYLMISSDAQRAIMEIDTAQGFAGYGALIERILPWLDYLRRLEGTPPSELRVDPPATG